MTTFTLRINCDNAAFCDDDGDPMPETEVCRILVNLTKGLERFGACSKYTLYDSNGNEVGTAGFEDD